MPNPSQYKWEGLYRLKNQPKKTKIKSLHVASSYSFTRNRMNTSGFCIINVSTWYWSPMGCTSTCKAWASSCSICVHFSGCSLRPIAAASAPWHWVTRRTWGRYVAQHGFSSNWLRDPWLDSTPLSDPWSCILNALETYTSLKNNTYMQVRFVIIKTRGLTHCLKALRDLVTQPLTNNNNIL